MKKIYLSFFAVFITLFWCNLNAQNPLTFTAVMDMTTPSGGSSGKAVMLTANQSVSDLSEYAMKTYSNGSTSASTFNLPAISISTG